MSLQTAARRPSRPRLVASQSDVAGADDGGVDELTLASLLSSRICHDLVNPVGALGTGLEVLSTGADQGSRDHAMRVIVEGAALADAKLQFYRAAFGYGGALGAASASDDLLRLTRNFLQGGRVQLDWRGFEIALDRSATRLLLNLVLIGVETLPRGGVLRAGALRKSASAPLDLLVMAEGPTIKFGARARLLLTEGRVPPGEEAPEPKEAPMLLTQRLVARAAAKLSFADKDGQIVLAASV